jgi:hypothetical protein
MKYEFTRVAARVEIIFGGLIILAGVALATLAMLPTSWIDLPFPKGSDDLLSRAARALVLFVSGLFAGALFIVPGQLTLVFLEIARRVARIDRRQRQRQQDEPPDQSRLLNRLRQR